MSDRKRRLEIAKSLKELLQSKGKAPSVKYQQTFEELKEASDLVSKELTTVDKFSLQPVCIYFKSMTMTYDHVLALSPPNHRGKDKVC